ncbi:hypothetical protein Pyn_25715 [Prunus yedoensis var. nudiflora]|uniref:FAF domain-containing protein n=1 Tax=Prunus yedoensis var. nudiflora TaxID=2094558 RepID=A0A314XTJ3_PRUYE|nr:hypothetical protein Pyn_25715 [Prunus yedoensis var. nudiflora]
MQSCVDVLTDEELGFGRLRDKPNRFSKREERSLRWAPKKMKMKDYLEVPPPIPLLARTENLPSHMPWILKRHYTTDGRLILTEEKVRHHEYFRAHRSNGRKCWNINSVGTRPPSILDVPVPAIRLIKATTNGPRKGFLGQAGFGGLFRNHAGRAVSAVCEPIGISAAHVTKLTVLMFAIITAWEKGWFRYGWKQILSWSYFFP